LIQPLFFICTFLIMGNITKAELLLSAQRALLFAIIPSVQFISVEITGNTLSMYVYVDKELNEEEKDIYYSAIAEMERDFAETHNTHIDFFISKAKFEDVKHLQHLVYARYEYLGKEYLQVSWKHDFEEDPVLIYSEIDYTRTELRKIELYKNGSFGLASADIEYGKSMLALIPIPGKQEIAADPQFVPKEITEEEFNALWNKYYLLRK
jgi:hypothetical protein